MLTPVYMFRDPGVAEPITQVSETQKQNYHIQKTLFYMEKGVPNILP